MGGDYSNAITDAANATGLGNWLFVIIVLAVFVVMSVVGFASMGVDKRKAQNGKWRVPEATLFAIAICFGGVGSTAGMFFFRHKTQHWYFKVFFPLFAVLEMAAVGVACYFLAVM